MLILIHCNCRIHIEKASRRHSTYNYSTVRDEMFLFSLSIYKCLYHFCITVIIDSILCFVSFLLYAASGLLGFYIAYIIIVSNYTVFI